MNVLWEYSYLYCVGSKKEQQTFNTGYLGSKKLQMKNKNMKVEQSFPLFSKYTGNKFGYMGRLPIRQFKLINKINIQYIDIY